MREEIYKLHYGSYLFLTTTDTGAEVGSRQTTLWFREKEATGKDNHIAEDSNWRFLRDFYFEETDYAIMRDFCKQFASDASYRTAALAGETHWGRRNALFFRNLLPLFGAALLLENGNYEQQIHDFFHWLDRYTEQIIELPSYQRLQTIDNVYKPHAIEIDPLILRAVEIFNEVPGIQTRFSCQGVSGKVQFHSYALLTVSHHEEFAYITFEPLNYFLHDSLLTLLMKFSSIVTMRMPDKPMLPLVLRSNGDNIRFRLEIRELAQRLLTHVIRSEYRASEDAKVIYWETACYPERQVVTTTPDGILPTRLAWLCTPEHIEETLKYVFFLSNWAHASDDLYYDDRQGLYTIKNTLLQQACLTGALQPVSYIDRSDDFTKRFNRELAICYAAEIFLDYITLLVESRQMEITDDDDNNRLARELFHHITGHDAHTIEDIDTLVLAGVEEAIRDQLDTIITIANDMHQPIKVSDLERIFIQPSDLLNLSWSDNDNWNDLNKGHLRKLDPEGYSLITFHYKSMTADYLFYLPYRFAENFLSQDLRKQYPHATEKGREHACYHNRLLTVEESREYTPQEILRILALDQTSLFPHKLARKKDRRFTKNVQP